MGVCIAKPKYPKYAIRATRLDSFKMWPRNMKQSPEELALAGFFFTDNYRLLFLDNKDKFEDSNVVIRSRGQTIQLSSEKGPNDKQ
jgi:hypothetical protein